MRRASGRVLIVLTTASSQNEATRIARAVANERLAACINIIPGITSIFRWDSRVQKSREVLLIFKTTRQRYPALERMIQSMHSYDVPEIIALSVESGFIKYIKWIGQETKARC
ncbi:divalent-cation tolerance protein CutA [Petrachloros mirabilis]